MVGILIVSHSRLAEALISSVEFFIGNLQKIKGISIWQKGKREEVRDRIRNGMSEVEDGEGIVILTDILRGTPTNLSLSLLKEEKIEVVTGVNMPMLFPLQVIGKGRH